jgi:two-component system cell cycle sensor histidine kinase/response regulator CckA
LAVDNGNEIYFNVLYFIIALIIISITLIYSKNISELVKSFRKTRSERLITETSKSEIDSYENSQNWMAFFHYSPLPSVIFDNKGKILEVNESFTKLMKKENINEGDNIGSYFHINPLDYSTLNKFDLYRYDETRLTNNKDRSYSAFIILIESDSNDENGYSNKYIGQFIDETEKTDLKEQFIQAQKMQAIGQLAGGVAHDFNNLLTAIIGFCDLLLTRHTPGDNDFVDIMQIKQNANRAANLVRQLLAFSRKQTMNMENIDPNEILTDISNLIRRLIGESIKFDVKYDRNVWDIKADKSQLEQVLINLAVNSRDAMDESGTLTISSRNREIINKADLKPKYANSLCSGEPEKGKYVCLYIEDDGQGISQEDLNKIFEPFFTTKGVGQGTGLGLATVSGIIEQSGGFIFVSSEVGKGTEFQIYLRKNNETTPKKQPKQELEHKIRDLSGQGKILIVEDEEPVRMFSSRALKNKGYEVIEAYDAENGLEMADKYQGQLDVIISDVVMPGMSGPEMASIINEKYPNIKIIFVSGYGEDAFYERYGIERKFNFLPKPYTLNQLASKVKEILGQ